MMYRRIFQFQPIRRICTYMYHLGPPPLSSHQSTSSQYSSHHSDLSHTRHGTQHGYYPYHPTTPPPPHGYPTHSPCQSSRASSIGVESSSLPSINTEEIVNFLVDKEKEEKSPKVQLDDVLVSASSSVSSNPVAFIPH